MYSIHIITQEEWGGREISEELNITPVAHELKVLTLHHGGVDWKEGTDPKEYLINLQSWSRSEKQWIDIPYHFMIDIDGKIYEARNPLYSGDTNTTYDPNGHLLTCLMGNYENRKPTVEQLDMLIKLLAWQCQKFSIDPGSLKAHKDYAETACPGKNLYAYVQDCFLEREVKKYIGKIQNK
ncbi:N-acetylmuramoyl-L-alanine amidase [candidate division KSB1 bacterium]